MRERMLDRFEKLRILKMNFEKLAKKSARKLMRKRIKLRESVKLREFVYKLYNACRHTFILMDH